MRVQVVRRFLQSRRRQTFRQRDNPIFDVLILVDENDEAATRFERHELDVAQARDLLFGENDAGAMRQARDQFAGFAQKLVDGLAAPVGDLRFDLAALFG